MHLSKGTKGVKVYKRLLFLLLVSVFRGIGPMTLSAQDGTETKTFPVQAGDTLAINDDFGKITIRPWDNPTIDVRIRKTAPDQGRKGKLEVASSKSGSTVFLYAFFTGVRGEAVDFDIRVPGFINVMIWGANPEVDIGNIQGLVRIQDLTGRITAENLTSGASLITDKGNIVYRMGLQPQGDTRLETTSGNVYCELGNRLNLRGWVRAGGAISWDREPALHATSLEKQLGSLGPLFYAGSVKGNIEVRLTEATAAKTPLIQAESSGLSARKNSEDAPETSHSTSRAQENSAATTSAEREPRNKPALADAPPATSPGGKYALRVNVDSVLLNVSVRDRATNRSVVGLQKDDFRVYEDGTQQPIEQFEPSEAPFDLLLLLDVSGSTAPYLKMMKKAAIDFTQQIKPNDRVAIATFNSRVRLVEKFTNDRSAAERAINGISSGGGTAFYDALMTCLRQYMKGIESRKAIVVFTDGVDNQLEGTPRQGSETRFDELYREVQETDTIIYTIFLDTEGYMTRGPTMGGGGIPGIGGRRRGGFPGTFPSPWPLPSPWPQPSPTPNPRRQQDNNAIYDEAREQLSEIAEQTGGRLYSPRKIEDLAGIYAEIADDLRIQYQLGYNSTNHSQDGRWRQIRVVVDNHPEAAVRTRRGYYPRKDILN